MKALAVHKISGDRNSGGGAFPFEFRGQTRAGPVRVSVRFEITEVGHGLGFVDGTKTGEREIPPGAIALGPVERRAPALFVDRGPAERKPIFRPGVSACFHEREELAVRDEPVRKRKWKNEG